MKNLKNLVLTATTLLYASCGTNASTVRWASSGGGWRSMVTNFGYVHAFERAGLISPTESAFTAASFNSGASWFASQLFYSEKFFDRVVGAGVDPDAIFDLSTEWLNNYQQYLGTTSSFFCNLLSFLGGISDTCNTAFQGPWYGFILGMLESAAANVYDDSGFATRVMNSANRNTALADTNLMFQTGLSEASRYSASSIFARRNSFITTEGASNVLAVPLAVQYTVTSSGTSFRYGIEDGEALLTCNAPGKRFFSFGDWDDWYRYPATGNTDIYSQRSVDSCDLVPFNEPFGGEATVAQVTSASSSNLASRSGSVPTMLSHHYSVALADDRGFIGTILTTVQAVFEYAFGPFFDNAVCTQTPGACGAGDGRLIDGGFTDGPSLAQNIGHHHTVENGDLNQPLKIILTNNNFVDDSNAKVLSYFATTFNSNVAPGEFIWAPFTVPDARSAQETPWRSPQIFSQFLDDQMLLDKFNEIGTTGITTASYEVTTIDNPAFGVKAGQTVEILLLQINSEIPVNFLFSNLLAANKDALAELSRTIAASDELVSRITAFMND